MAENLSLLLRTFWPTVGACQGVTAPARVDLGIRIAKGYSSFPKIARLPSCNPIVACSSPLWPGLSRFSVDELFRTSNRYTRRAGGQTGSGRRSAADFSRVQWTAWPRYTASNTVKFILSSWIFGALRWCILFIALFIRNIFSGVYALSPIILKLVFTNQSYQPNQLDLWLHHSRSDAQQPRSLGYR